MSKISTVAAVAVAVAISSAAMGDDAPGIASSTVKWTQDDVVKYQLTQDGCHNYAVDTMSRADAKELDTQARSVFGTIYHDGSAYSVSIRCEVDNRIAFLMVAGNNDGLEPVLKQLGDAWNPPKKDQSTSSKQPQRSLKASKKRSEKSV